jgi:hypothetical protein
MNCPRCHGLMVPTRLEEAVGATSGESISGWKCLLCGEVIDSVIAANRKGHQEPMPSRARLPYGTALAKARGPKRKEMRA